MSAPVMPVAAPGGVNYPPSQVPPMPSVVPPTPAAAQPVTPQAPTPAPAPAPQPVAQPTLSGPGIPPELQGRTLSEAMSIYSTLRQEHLSRFPAPSPTPAPTREYAAGDPRGRQPAAPADGNVSFWAQPEERIAQIIDERLNTAMAPVVGQAQASAARTARDTVAARFGQAYLAMEDRVLAKLQNLDPRLLADPNAWANAYYLAAGEAQVTGAMPMAPPAPAAPVVTTAAPGFVPSTAAFFSEAPRPTSPAVTTGSLTSQEISVAQKMGMTAEQYTQWKGGVRG